MKVFASSLVLAVVLAMHACAANADQQQLRSADDTLDSIVPDAMVLGSVRSKNRLIAVSTADDDTAVMTTVAKTTSRARDATNEGATIPTRGSSAAVTKNAMVARSDVDSDRATLTRASATLVRAEDPDASRSADE